VGRTYDGIDERLRAWIEQQPLFFVGTAPRADDGHVNVSPKGPIGTLRVLGPLRLAYLDMIGSGAETIAHLRENGRIVVMLCAFAGPPRILRMYGRGIVHTADSVDFDRLVAQAEFPVPTVAATRRAVVEVAVTRVADSCGYGVPLMTFDAHRPHMDAWAAKKVRVGGEEALRDYQRERNAVSLDGLPAVDLA
jgi:hypothetical protein